MGAPLPGFPLPATNRQGKNQMDEITITRVLVYRGMRNWVEMTLQKSFIQGKVNFGRGSIEELIIDEEGNVLRRPNRNNLTEKKD